MVPFRVGFSRMPGEFKPVKARHLDIHQDQTEWKSGSARAPDRIESRHRPVYQRHLHLAALQRLFHHSTVDRIILQKAIDAERSRQVRDLSGVPTAAHCTQWVTTAIAANMCG